MEEQFEDHRKFGPSSLESRNEASVLMVAEDERRIHLYINPYPANVENMVSS
jgi:hypothetical protein